MYFFALLRQALCNFILFFFFPELFETLNINNYEHDFNY